MVSFDEFLKEDDEEKYNNMQHDLLENKRLNNIIKKVEECIEHYAIENEDFSKFYNNEEIEILKIIGSEKE